MRKYYIDNIRIICVLLLFPFHTCVIFNSFNDSFYVLSKPVTIFSDFIIAVYPWWMSLLFTIAGVSSAYALKKRTGKVYMQERISKLLIPLLFGILLILPVQSYIADKYHNGYSGGYFQHYSVFFTKFTDLTGYDGGFTPGHMWFMLYLFIISMITLPLMLWYNQREKKINASKITMPVLLPMFVLIILMTPVLDISGKSIGESLACFLIGFFLVSLEEVQDRLMKYRLPLAAMWIILIIIRLFQYHNNMGNGIGWDIEQRMLTWFGIMAILGLGKKYLNFNNKFTSYFSPAAFPIYFLHQSILVIVAYFTVSTTDIIMLQFVIILTASFVVTMLCYEAFRRFSFTCFMLGIKKAK